MMAINGTVRKWGNSVGIRLSKEDMTGLNISVDDQVVVEIKKKDNPLRELSQFFVKNNLRPITKESIKRARKELEGEYYKG